MFPWKPTLSGATWNSASRVNPDRGKVGLILAGRSSSSDRQRLESRCGRALFDSWRCCAFEREDGRQRAGPSETRIRGVGTETHHFSSSSRRATAVPTRAWGEPLRRILPKINSLLSKEAASSRAVATNTRPPKGLQEPPVMMKPTIRPLSRTGWHRRGRLLPTSLSSTTDAMPTGSWDRRARKVETQSGPGG